jgi:hypothetical protein
LGTRRGKLVLQRDLEALQSELENYFGQQNELLNGLTIEDEVIEKPVELIRYEMVKAFGLPVWEGGLADQPHIWLLQYKIIDTVVRLFESLRIASEEAKQRSRESNGTQS